MSLECALTHSTNLFNYDPITKEFFAEESTLGRSNCVSEVYYPGQLAVGEGFWLESAKTGRKILFLFDNHDMHEGEIVASTFKQAEGTDGFTVCLLND